MSSEPVRSRRLDAARLVAASGHLAAGRWSEALADLDSVEAVSPLVRAQRAVALDRLGKFEEAVREWALVARSRPAAPEPRLAAAQVLQDQAQYGRSLRWLDRAVLSAPASTEPRLRRARLLWLQGRIAEAAADIALARKVRPEQPSLLLESARFSILQGRWREAEAGLDALERAVPRDPESSWLRGLAACRRRRYRKALTHFEEHRRRIDPRDEAAYRRASFYVNVVRVLDSFAEAEGGSGSGLRLCGLGYRHPYQVSVEVVRALAACTVIYSNHSDPAVAEFVSLFPAQPKVVVFRRWRSQAASCARQVFSGLREDRLVGFVTRGHPLFFGRLAEKMVLRARRSGVDCRVYGSVSIADVLPGLAAEPGVGGEGLHIIDGRILSEGSGPGLKWGGFPTVVYNIGEPEQRRKLASELALRFRPTQPCFLLAGAGGEEFSAKRRNIGRLGRELESSDPAVTIYIPAGRP